MQLQTRRGYTTTLVSEPLISDIYPARFTRNNLKVLSIISDCNNSNAWPKKIYVELFHKDGRLNKWRLYSSYALKHNPIRVSDNSKESRKKYALCSANKPIRTLRNSRMKYNIFEAPLCIQPYWVIPGKYTEQKTLHIIFS